MHPKTILIVDDEESVRKLAQKFLESEGYQVHTAGSASEAIDIARQLACGLNLLLSDMIMPGCDGHELIRAVRQLCPLTETMMMSGAFLPDDVRVKDYKVLAKPFTRPQLVAAAKDIFDCQVF